MTPMKFSVRLALFAGLVVGLAGLPALASQGQQQPKQGQSAQQPQKPQTGKQQPAQTGSKAQPAVQKPGEGVPAGKKLNPAEEKAYQTFYKLPPAQAKEVISSGEAFLKKYPDSHYAGSVYSRLTSAYEVTGQDQKMFDAGEKALKLNPKNVDVLSMLAYTIPRRINPNDLGAADKLQEAADYAKRALALLATMPKPANLTDEQFAAAKQGEEASCHSGLGLVYLHEHNVAGAVTELEQAVKLDPTPDPTNQFLLGFAYAQAGRWNDAVGPLTSCSSTPNPVANRCKEVLAAVKKHVTAQPKPKPKQ
jgi:tetratricopeptide (TPR) repeat protein